MKKGLLLAIFVVLSLLVSFAGCGGGGKTTETTTPKAETPTTPPTTSTPTTPPATSGQWLVSIIPPDNAKDIPLKTTAVINIATDDETADLRVHITLDPEFAFKIVEKTVKVAELTKTTTGQYKIEFPLSLEAGRTYYIRTRLIKGGVPTAWAVHTFTTVSK